MIMNNHMQMSLKAARNRAMSSARRKLLVAARKVLTKYADLSTAEEARYKRFGRADRMGEEVHCTNYRYGRQAHAPLRTEIGGVAARERDCLRKSGGRLPGVGPYRRG